MRKLNLLVALVLILISFNSFAQNKIGFKYQTIIRDNNNNILENKAVSFRMSLLKGSTTGIPVYRETFNAITNSNGLVTLDIGNGTMIFGSFDAILWYDDNYFIKVEFDPNGGTNFQLMGVSQLLAVPYSYVSLWTKKAVNDMDTSPTNELQTLSLNGHNLSISQGNTISLPLGDTSNTNKIQMLSFSNDTLYLSNGGFVYLGKFNNAVSLNDFKARLTSDSLFLKSLIDTNTAHINTEKTNRINDDQTLNTAINNEITLRTNSVALITNNLNALKTKQITDSTFLHNLINTNTANLTTEITNRQTADNGINAKIIADSSFLKYRIDSALTSITNEISARTTSEGAIYVKIKADSTYLKDQIDNILSPINTEIVNRLAADIVTNTRITTDSTYFDAQIINNSSAINAEITDRQTADNGIYTKINADSTYLDGQISNNTSAINTEIANRQTADNDIYTKVKADSTYLIGQINTNANDITTINSNLSTNYYTKTNVQTSGNALIHWDNLTNKPTTLLGYGITDATPINHIGSNGTSHDTSNLTTAGFMSMHDKVKLTAITGTNTGDQTITLTGDVTGSGTGSFATTISSNAVTNSKIANNSVDGTKIQLGTEANGALMYYNGSDWVKLPAGTNGQILKISGGIPTWVTKHYIGESYGGGIIFYVDATGQHGLISTAADISSSVWSNVNSLAIGVSAMSLTDGNSNSNAIVGQGGHTNSAASICLGYSNTTDSTYSDWYLPAQYQLNLLYNQTYAVGLFANGSAYWSSTEVAATTAYRYTFLTSTQAATTKVTVSYVRCIRTF